MPKNNMRALCALIRPDHFKFASNGPAGKVRVLAIAVSRSACGIYVRVDNKL